MIKITAFFYGFFWLGQVCLGQDFRFKALVAQVPESGFYKIQVTPAITRHLQNTFSDLRLYDQKNQEVPYVLVRERPAQTPELFRKLEVIRKSIEPGGQTTLILRNPHPGRINNISLVVKTAGVRKVAQLSGSPDTRQWFTIKTNYLLLPVANQAALAAVYMVDFPPSNYKYYKLGINNAGTPPLSVISAGYYDTQSENKKYAVVPDFNFKQIDSSQVKKTYLRFSSPAPIIIDKLEFKVKSPTFYHRRVTLFQKQQRRIRRRRLRETYEPLTQLLLKPGTTNSLLLAGLQTKGFYLEIENADNPPLVFESIRAYLLNTYLVADLKKGQAYYLQFGNEKVEAPSYELTYFKSNIPENIAVLVPRTVLDLEKPKASGADHSGKRFFKNSFIIWAAILLVIGLLAYMSYQMLQETSKK